jgi:hypothetical protein
MSLNNRELLIWKERGKGRERERGRRAGRSAGRHIKGKVRFGRDRGDRQRDRDTKIQRDIEPKRHIDKAHH